MTTPFGGARIVEFVHEESFTSQGVVDDTRRGLQDNPKWLSSLYFYDRAGSELFEQLTHTDEYYPTRTEESILSANVDDILDTSGADLVLAEMGSGSSRKTRVVLDAMTRQRGPSTYWPIDVSAEFLHDVAEQLQSAFPDLTVEPIAAEYSDGIRQVGARPAKRRLVMFLGSSIGNFEPEEQLALLQTAHDALSPGDAFLLGTDLVKDAAILEAAYNDEAGMTAAFNLNILNHLNHELDGDATLDQFDHRAHFDAQRNRIEMHLVSKCDQVLHFPKANLEVRVVAGESIHTENSYKFSIDGAQSMARKAGFEIEKTWTDDKQWFGLHLLRRQAD
jgi:L-histidine N-alpha-methyltransferase